MLLLLEPHGGAVIKRKDYMKRKLLVLLITAASTMMPNFASAIAIDLDLHDFCRDHICH